jgi:hypothetical protein
VRLKVVVEDGAFRATAFKFGLSEITVNEIFPASAEVWRIPRTRPLNV